MIIQGTIAKGKSYLISAIYQLLEKLSYLEYYPLLLLAPTKVIAFNTGATIIHGTLWILVVEFEILEGKKLINFQEELQHIKYVLIYELYRTKIIRINRFMPSSSFFTIF